MNNGRREKKLHHVLSARNFDIFFFSTGVEPADVVVFDSRTGVATTGLRSTTEARAGMLADGVAGDEEAGEDRIDAPGVPTRVEEGLRNEAESMIDWND